MSRLTPFEREIRDIHGDEVIEPQASRSRGDILARYNFWRLPWWGKAGVLLVLGCLVVFGIGIIVAMAFILWLTLSLFSSPVVAAIGTAVGIIAVMAIAFTTAFSR